MASITTILGTDSLASSRIVLNDNFDLINEEVIEIKELLDVEAGTLTLAGDINANQLNLVDSGVNLFVVNTSGISASLPVSLDGSLVLGAGLEKSIALVQAMPIQNAYSKSAYVLDATHSNLSGGTNIVAPGNQGQEVTFIASGGSISISEANIAGATSVSIANNGTLTLRYYNTLWYIISHFNATIAV
jgi:hypothetical protein